MRTSFRSILTAALVAVLTMPATAAMHRHPSHAKAQSKTSQITRQVPGQVTVNDAALGEGQGVASGAPTGLSGQIATGDLAADAARDNNPSNGTATNIGPASM